MKKKLHLGRRPDREPETNSTLDELRKELSCQPERSDFNVDRS